MKRQSSEAAAALDSVKEYDVKAKALAFIDVGPTQKGLIEFMSDTDATVRALHHHALPDSGVTPGESVAPAQQGLPGSVFLTECQSVNWHFLLHEPTGSGHSLLLPEGLPPCTGDNYAQ